LIITIYSFLNYFTASGLKQNQVPMELAALFAVRVGGKESPSWLPVP